MLEFLARWEKGLYKYTHLFLHVGILLVMIVQLGKLYEEVTMYTHEQVYNFFTNMHASQYTSCAE